MNNPERVFIDNNVIAPALNLKQENINVSESEKYSVLHEQLDKREGSIIIFVKTKHGADKVVKVLLKHNVKAEAIHGNKAQNARQRALNNFKDQSTRVLVATDIAARGIDVDDLEFVVNYEIPNIAETYVHRIGRTGRAGAKGTAVSFCAADEKEYLRDIEKLISKKIPVVDNHPFPLTIHHVEKAKPQQRQPRNHGQGQSKPAAQKSATAGNGGKRKWHGNQR